jgi:hypothetical protein
MKLQRLLIFLIIASSFLMITACGGVGGSPISYGEVIVHVTDANPLLPEGAGNVTNLFISFTGISVHKSGGGWISLLMAEDPPYTIDLLQFINSNTTEIVPPVLLEYGKYTQIRLEIDSAKIRFDDDPNTDSPVIIPPAYLKVDENFIFDVNEPRPINIVIDFDLSQSLVVIDSFGKPSYKLNPVLHIVRAAEAATITGEIDQGSFILGQNVQVTVYAPNPYFPGTNKEYTKVEISDSGTDPAEFSIYWLAPNQVYSVEIDFDPDLDNGIEFSEDVKSNDLESRKTWYLNGGTPI